MCPALSIWIREEYSDWKVASMHKPLEGLTLGTPQKYGHTDTHMFKAKEQAPLVRRVQRWRLYHLPLVP